MKRLANYVLIGVVLGGAPAYYQGYIPTPNYEYLQKTNDNNKLFSKSGAILGGSIGLFLGVIDYAIIKRKKNKLKETLEDSVNEEDSEF